MTGPDADLWPGITVDGISWDWQSNTPCFEGEDLVARGDDDDSLVAAVGRYTIENLILNAAHEIGEWFRFDGRRVFPAHTRSSAGPGEQDPQGNGAVALQVIFEHAGERHGAATIEPMVDEEGGQRLVSRLDRIAAASRFTYLPGTTISYEAAGPVIRTRVIGKAVTTWRSSWSISTLDAAGADVDEVMPLAARDVHHALVSDETDRICRAFHIDGRRAWRLAGQRPPLGAEPPETDAAGAQLLSVSTGYAVNPDEIDQPTSDQQDGRDSRRR